MKTKTKINITKAGKKYLLYLHEKQFSPTERGVAAAKKFATMKRKQGFGAQFRGARSGGLNWGVVSVFWMSPHHY